MVVAHIDAAAFVLGRVALYIAAICKRHRSVVVIQIDAATQKRTIAADGRALLQRERGYIFEKDAAAGAVLVRDLVIGDGAIAEDELRAVVDVVDAAAVLICLVRGHSGLPADVDLAVLAVVADTAAVLSRKVGVDSAGVFDGHRA